MAKSGINFAPIFVHHYLLQLKNFKEHCLANNIAIAKKLVNLYISYILNPSLRNLNTDSTLKNAYLGL